MGVISRAHSWVSVWFPNISFKGINFFPQQCVVFVVCIFLFLHSFQIHDFLSSLSWRVFVSFFFFILFRSILFLSLSWWVCFCLYLSFFILNFLDLCSCVCDLEFMFKYEQLMGVAMGLQPWVSVERVHIINFRPWACGGEWPRSLWWWLWNLDQWWWWEAKIGNHGRKRTVEDFFHVDLMIFLSLWVWLIGSFGGG